MESHKCSYSIINETLQCKICNKSFPIHNHKNLELLSKKYLSDSIPTENVLYINGPGTELKKLLSKIGIKSSPDCSCNYRAQQMNNMEQQQPGWCIKNMDTIIEWLREESEKRGLPFIEMIARGIVKLAIKRAKKKIK